LGCEGNQISSWLDASGLQEGQLLQTFNIQDSGGTRHTVEKGIALVNAMLPQANQVQRKPCSAATSPSACNAAAPTATRASAPTRRWALRWTCWWRMGAPPS